MRNLLICFICKLDITKKSLNYIRKCITHSNSIDSLSNHGKNRRKSS